MDEQKVTSFFRFEDLRVYHKSLEYYNYLVNQVKWSEEFAQKSVLMPLLDCAAKVSINIAEGSSNHKAQFIEYLKLAKSAVRQCVVLTELAHQNTFFSDLQYEESRNMLMEITKMIGAMIVSLQKNNKEDKELKDNSFSI